MSNDGLRESLMKGLRQFATRPVDEAIARRLLECVTSIEADPTDPASFDALRQRLERLEANRSTGGNRLFYLATPPNAFLADQPRTRPYRSAAGGKRRMAAAGDRKPFGTDLASAQALNAEFAENRRRASDLSHRSLSSGKETVQNILVLRFANGMFEPIWNRNHIDHIQSPSTKNSASPPRQFLRTQPARCATWSRTICSNCCRWSRWSRRSGSMRIQVRSEKADVLAAIQTQSEADALKNSVRGQYQGGKIGDAGIEDYCKTEDVKPGSTTENLCCFETNHRQLRVLCATSGNISLSTPL